MKNGPAAEYVGVVAKGLRVDPAGTVQNGIRFIGVPTPEGL